MVMFTVMAKVPDLHKLNLRLVRSTMYNLYCHCKLSFTFFARNLRLSDDLKFRVLLKYLLHLRSANCIASAKFRPVAKSSNN